jgi:hypothetical protein
MNSGVYLASKAVLKGSGRGLFQIPLEDLGATSG